jgi:hypothetical protein
MKDNFSTQSAGYSKYRPGYPPELFEFILEHVPGRKIAWDCATGNGQTAKELALHFDKVIATDISASQLQHARSLSNIEYKVEPAEKTTIADTSIDLVTVSQALHWLQWEAFYEEVKRTGKPNSWIAAWMYDLPGISPQIDQLVSKYFYREVLHGYWDYERRYVDDHYTTIPFPFEEISCPVFSIRLEWSIDELEGYILTWSAVQKFMQVNNFNPVTALMKQVKPAWTGERIHLHFPVYMRMGRIQK